MGKIQILIWFEHTNNGNKKFGKVIFIRGFKFRYDFNKTFAPNMKFPEGR